MLIWRSLYLKTKRVENNNEEMVRLATIFPVHNTEEAKMLIWKNYGRVLLASHMQLN